MQLTLPFARSDADRLDAVVDAVRGRFGGSSLAVPPRCAATPASRSRCSRTDVPSRRAYAGAMTGDTGDVLEIDDDELAELALAADPDVDLDADAVPFLPDQTDGDELLPAWYMPAPRELPPDTGPHRGRHVVRRGPRRAQRRRPLRHLRPARGRLVARRARQPNWIVSPPSGRGDPTRRDRSTGRSCGSRAPNRAPTATSCRV